MNRKSLGLLVVPLLLAAGAGAESRGTIHVTAAARALEVVATAERHRTVVRGGLKTTFHPGWISKIQVVDAQGKRKQIYRQTEVYMGRKPQELALTFRDSALAVIDPEGEILKISARTTDGEEWTFDEEAEPCPPDCQAGVEPPPMTSDELPLSVEPEVRALQMVEGAADKHQTLVWEGRNAIFHPGWIRKIQVVDAQGNREELYRQTEAYKGKKPKELALTFRDSALVVIDPKAQIFSITVHLKDGEVWSFEDSGLVCPPVCSGGDR